MIVLYGLLFFMEGLEAYFDKDFLEVGEEVLTYEYIESLREDDSDYTIVAQRGSQELFLSTDADILIFGGKRGGSKSYSLLLETLYDIDNPNFSGCILRKEKEDSRKAGGLIDKSDPIYNQFGVYNRGQNDMTWNFSAGGRLKFDYYSDTFEEFTRRFRGQELAYIGVDEITHMKYAYFKFLLTSNRNAYHIKNRFVGTCNPDPDSWVANFIDWWLDKDGYPIPERNGVIRYCFMPGDDISDIYWGNTKQEVYEKAKHLIDRRWKKEYEIFGTKEDMFIKSVTFIEGKLEENIKLLKSDPNYLANLANQSEEQVSRDLDGNWKFKTAGLELISFNDMNAMFNNSYQIGSARCVTCDPAYDGGDKCVLWYWEGFHAKDLQVITLDPQRTEDYIREFLKLHNVLEDNFCYDLPGVGQVLRKMKNARPFSPKAMPTDGSRSKFENLKSECAYKFVERIKNRGYSIEPSILDMKFSGKGYKNLTVREILLKERKAIARCDKDLDKNWKLISKPEMKQIVGHSPDFVESLIIREYFEMVKPKKRREIKSLQIQGIQNPLKYTNLYKKLVFNDPNKELSLNELMDI